MVTVTKHVAACIACQQQMYQAISPTGLLQPLLIPKTIWDDISMDFITGLSRSNGFDAILIMVDRLSKYAHFISLKHPFSAQIMVELFA